MKLPAMKLNAYFSSCGSYPTHCSIIKFFSLKFGMVKVGSGFFISFRKKYFRSALKNSDF